MDPVTIALAKLGFSLAGVLFVFIRRSVVRPDKPNDLFQIREYIQNSAKTMQETIHDAVQEIVNKLEQDQFELLLSRTRNLADLVRMRVSDDTLLHSAMQLRECVDYAHNRFREGKPHWLGPFMAGNSVYLACLEVANKLSSDDIQRFNEFVLEAKINLLEQSMPNLIDDGKKVPWRQIAEFLRDEGVQVVPKLLAYVPVSAKPIEVEEKKKRKAAAATKYRSMLSAY